MAIDRKLDRYVGESEFVSIDFRLRLIDGQTLASVEWTAESPVELVVGSDGVTGTVASGRFDTPSAGQYTVTAKVTTADPEEEKIEYVILVVKAIPT